MGPSVEGVLTIHSNGSALLNKMAAMPIYGKKYLKVLRIFFSRTNEALKLNLCAYQLGLQVYQGYSTITFDFLWQICVLVAVIILEECSNWHLQICNVCFTQMSKSWLIDLWFAKLLEFDMSANLVIRLCSSI